MQLSTLLLSLVTIVSASPLVSPTISPANIPVISFKAGYTQTVTGGTLKKGGQAKIVYDIARVPSKYCIPTSEDGGITWDVLMYYQFNKGNVLQPSLPIYYGPFPGDQVLTTPIINLTSAGTLSIWFKCSSEASPAWYDSNFANNYNFSVSP